jgi:hypothetical protein
MEKVPSIVIATNGQVYCDAEPCRVSKLYEKALLCDNCEGRKCPLRPVIRCVAKGVVAGIGQSLAQNFQENLNIIYKTFDDGATDISEQQKH